ncbi:hypothetical protein JNM05_04610 [bacterium]|nr:hypothetical protein [bacterium]
MFDRIKFQIQPKSVRVTVDPFFANDYVLYHEVNGEIRLLERDMEGFETSEDMCIYDTSKEIQYDIDKKENNFTITVEEMDLDTLLFIGLPREALDQIILLKKRVINPR